MIVCVFGKGMNWQIWESQYPSHTGVSNRLAMKLQVDTMCVIFEESFRVEECGLGDVECYLV